MLFKPNMKGYELSAAAETDVNARALEGDSGVIRTLYYIITEYFIINNLLKKPKCFPTFSPRANNNYYYIYIYFFNSSN